MLTQLKNLFTKRERGRRSRMRDIAPDEIFMDSKNLPDFDTDQFEGRIEKPISNGVFSVFVFIIVCVGIIFGYKIWDLQVTRGQALRNQSDNNSLRKTVIFSNRGGIFDRNGEPIVWNTISEETPDFSLRVYATSTGLSTILGYVKYPAKDVSGNSYKNKFDPKDGLEKIYNTELSGIDGVKISETDVKGTVVSESVVEPPVDGANLNLSIDLGIQKKMHSALLDIASRAGYKGGAGIIMDVTNGEILASSNFPEYDSAVMTDGSDSKKINNWLTDKNHPFLNRIIGGLYTPGSIMKLFVAMGVLQEKVITPEKQILSTGSISIPNPFDKTKQSVFVDWKAHGWVDIRKAIAVSSNVYFYEVGGGYQGQKGIGIANIEKYARMFGFGSTTGIYFPGERDGTIPDPAWKAVNFKGEAWRVGDTYHTAIGQYGFQVSPIQVVRAVSALANEGTLLIPTFLKGQPPEIAETFSLDADAYRVVKEGMRQGVTDGTSRALNFPFVKVASKTGTAQINVAKDQVNSWVVGFWPLDKPRYAYAVVLEKGPKVNQFGAVLVMQQVLDWMHIYKPDYLN